MQRYRVNFPLLVGLVVGTVVITAGAYFLWRFQLNRNAGRLLTRAVEAREEGELGDAISFYSQYLSIRGKDEQVISDLAEVYGDLVEDPDVRRRDIAIAFAQLERTVSEQPDNQLIRRRLIDLRLKFNDQKGALEHISQLLNQNPEDQELWLMQSTGMFATRNKRAVEHAYKLIGYDESTDSYDEAKAIAPNEPIVYLRTAVTLQSERAEDDLAQGVIDQMLAVNPESGIAMLYSGQYKLSIGDRDGAEEDYRKALELDPIDPQVVVTNAQLIARGEDAGDAEYEQALNLLENALPDNPEEASIYQAMAGIEAVRRDTDAAIACFDRGIEALPPEKSHTLRFYKARLQVQAGEVDAARTTLAELREEARLPEQLLDYLQARIAMVENQWFEASQDFEKLRSFISKIPELSNELNLFLGLCYERLEQYDKSLASYDVALQNDPTNKMARFGRSRILEQLGRSATTTSSTSIYTALADELGKEEAEQDWEAFDLLVEQYCEQLDLSEAMRLVLRGEVFMRRGLYEEARALLIEANNIESNNLGVKRAAVKLFASDPEQGPIMALRLLDKVVEDLGDMPILRLDRADLLIAINDEDLSEQLFALADGTDDWPAEDKVQLWNGLANKFLRIRDTESRQECLAKVAEFSPNDLSTLQRLFLMARQSEDQAGMKEVQDRILKVVGEKNDPLWQFTEAHRLLSLYRSEDRRKELLDQAENFIDTGLSDRPDWHQLHLVKAELALLRNDAIGALASFDRASELGRPTTTSLYQHVKLLMSRARFTDAIREMEKINSESRTQFFGRDYADALLRTGKTSEAIVAAENVARLSASDAAVQLWYGQLLSNLAKLDTLGEERRNDLRQQAGEVLRAAVDLNPNSPESWGKYVAHLAGSGDRVAANEAIREANLVLTEDANLMLFARCYQLVGRMVDAEERYKQALEDAPTGDRVRALRLLAEFYLSSAKPNIKKATPLVNELLKMAAEGELEQNNPHVRWARSSAARIFASKRDYQSLQAAQNLLSSNAVDNRLPLQDRLLMVEILGARPEPISRLKAANLLEELKQTQQLTVAAELLLGKLYYNLGRWRECREQMSVVIARAPDDSSIRKTYLQMLLERGGPNEMNTAVRQLKRLMEIAPNDAATRELVARVAMKRGKKQEAVRALRSMLPSNLAQVQPEQVAAVLRVANVLVSFEEYESAEPLFKIAAQKGGAAEQLALAEFLGMHRDMGQGFTMLETMYRQLKSPALIQKALTILRSQDEDTDIAEYAQKAEEWIDAALREDPDRIALQMLRADLLDQTERYSEAADLFRAMLQRDDLQGNGRAVVLNNLAYLLALSGSNSSELGEAVTYINEAVSLLGPQTDVLDTRAVVAIANERFSDAVDDLELAVIDKPTPVKYFHLATAQLLSGNKQEASEAWRQAIDRGLTREEVSRLERERYDSVKSELEGLGLISANL